MMRIVRILRTIYRVNNNHVAQTCKNKCQRIDESAQNKSAIFSRESKIMMMKNNSKII